MKSKRVLALLLLAALLTVMTAPAAAAAPAEERSVTITITSAEQLQQLARDCVLDSYSVGLRVSLEADLDLSGLVFQPIPIFAGVFDGQGHSISGLDLTGEGSHMGLFRYLQPGAEVKDLHVTGDVTPGEGQHYIGGIAGTNRGTIRGCSFSGTVSGLRYIGGIAGENEGSILDCTVSGRVDGKRATGGIAGGSSGEIRGCSSDAEINTSISEAALDLEDISLSGDGVLDLTNAEDDNVVSDSGGIVGLSTGTVSGCVNRGTVGYPHFGYNVGGIAGRQSGYLSGCENLGEIQGLKDVGGIVGQMEPYLLLLESINMADELRLLNFYMNAASADVGQMSGELSDTLDQIEASSDSASGKIGGDTGGSISHPGEGAEGAGGTIQSASRGSILGDENGGGLTDDDIQAGLDQIGDNTDINTDDITVPDGLADDLNDMADGMNQMAGIVASSSGILADDLANVNNQLSRVLMLMANALNGASNRRILEDGSDEMDEEDLLGRVSACRNHAPVSGDTNIGGIAGDMGIEYEFDMDGNLAEAIGLEGIVSNTYETHCVGSGNVNEGSVNGRKDAIGGIVGQMELGTVSACESYGPVSGEGQYVGGVAGYSYASIRGSYAMCDVSGSGYVGGIAGFGTRISGCGSLVGLPENAVCRGAIAGYAEAESEDLADNVYVHDSVGAVDGISYSEKAAPISYAELLEREGVPERFRSLKLSFVADGELVAELAFDYGGAIDESQIPEVPAKEGYGGSWPDFPTQNLTYSAVIEAVYTPRQGALASRQTREDSPMSIVLVEGDFADRAEIGLYEYTGDGPVLTQGEIIEKWVLRLSGVEEDQRYAVRYLPPELGERHARVELYLRGDSGWTKLTTSKNGSYLSFDGRGDTLVFCVVKTRGSAAATAAIGVAGAAVLAGAALVLRKKRRAKRQAETPAEPS